MNFINSLLTRALHDRTLNEAVAVVKAQVAEFDQGRRKELGLEAGDEVETWIDRKAQRFVKSYLPVLVKFDIVSNA